MDHDPMEQQTPRPPRTGRHAWVTWVVEEARDHLFPWAPQFWRQRSAAQAAGIAFALFITLMWVLAAAGRIGPAAVLAWWTAWSVYEVLCRRRCKPWVKVGPWWGRDYQPATTADLVFYVATKNLLIGVLLFLLLAGLGLLAP